MSKVPCRKLVQDDESGKWGACYLDVGHGGDCKTTELIADIMQEIRNKESDYE